MLRQELSKPPRRHRDCLGPSVSLRGLTMLVVLQDLKYGLRRLARERGFTAVAVLTLALGIGANTAIFSMVRAVLLRPLPFPESSRLVNIWRTTGPAQQHGLLAIPDVQEFARDNHTMDQVGIVRGQSVNLTGTDRPDRLTGTFITATTLDLLGARTSRGRLFTSAETQEGGGEAVAVLSNALWQTRFGGDPSMVGRSLTLNGRPHVIIGITASDFRDPFGPTDVWLPITSAPNPNWFSRENPNVWAIGRRKTGVTLAQVNADLSRIAARLAQEHPATNAAVGVSVTSFKADLVGQFQRILLIVLAFVGVVLLIACANLANLQLARGTRRRHELALRAAIGANRWRLIRQLLTESVLLALVGGGLGILLAEWGVAGLAAAVPGGLPVFGGAVSVDRPVLLFSLAVILVASILFGLVPAWHAARVGLHDALNLRSSAAGGAGAERARNVFVIAQLALCIVLLVGAGLLARSLVKLNAVNPGFEPGNVLTAEFRLPSVTYGTPERVGEFMTRAIAAIRAVHGVESAALAQSVPLSGNQGSGPYIVEARAGVDPSQAPLAMVNLVSEDFFGTMRIPVVQGRDFTPADRPGSLPVVIVNQELVRREWPNQSPIGQRIKLIGETEWLTVAGVVGNVRHGKLEEPDAPQVYLAMAQSPRIFTSIVARTSGDPMALADALRRAVWSVDPDQPVWRIRSMDSILDGGLAVSIFTTRLVIAFAALALLLAAIGVYGVVTYTVNQRTREMGIRMALGAEQGDVVWMILRSGLLTVIAATVTGTVVALMASRLIQQELFSIGAADPVTFIAAALLLGMVAMLACYLPARRAAGIDPMVALREE